VSEIFSVQLTAVFTAILGVGAIVTAILAFLAWRKQSQEVRDQAEMLRVQGNRLAEERKVSAEQIRVLALQADELKQVSADRGREAHERRRARRNWCTCGQKSAPQSSPASLSRTGL
jgi:gas vesicle protein